MICTISNFKKLNKYYNIAYNFENINDEGYLRLVSNLLSTQEVESLSNNIQHNDITTLEHVICVSFLSYAICKRLGLNYIAAARGGLLHDLVYYDWHKVGDGSHRLHGFRHPGFALNNARELTSLSLLEENIIVRHMWPLTPTPPKYKEALIVSLVDKYCAARETFGIYDRKNQEDFS